MELARRLLGSARRLVVSPIAAFETSEQQQPDTLLAQQQPQGAANGGGHNDDDRNTTGQYPLLVGELTDAGRGLYFGPTFTGHCIPSESGATEAGASTDAVVQNGGVVQVPGEWQRVASTDPLLSTVPLKGASALSADTTTDATYQAHRTAFFVHTNNVRITADTSADESYHALEVVVDAVEACRVRVLWCVRQVAASVPPATDLMFESMADVGLVKHIPPFPSPHVISSASLANSGPQRVVFNMPNAALDLGVLLDEARMLAITNKSKTGEPSTTVSSAAPESVAIEASFNRVEPSMSLDGDNADCIPLHPIAAVTEQVAVDLRARPEAADEQDGLLDVLAKSASPWLALVVIVETVMDDARQQQQSQMPAVLPMGMTRVANYYSIVKKDVASAEQTTTASKDGNTEEACTATLDQPTSATATAATAAFQLRFIAQKAAVNGQVLELQEIYGMPAASTAAIAELAATDEHQDKYARRFSAATVTPKDCVVCLSDPRCVMPLPCRHMCLCADCARVLKGSGAQCPVCRQPFHSLLRVDWASADPSP